MTFRIARKLMLAIVLTSWLVSGSSPQAFNYENCVYNPQSQGACPSSQCCLGNNFQHTCNTYCEECNMGSGELLDWECEPEGGGGQGGNVCQCESILE